MDNPQDIIDLLQSAGAQEDVDDESNAIMSELLSAIMSGDRSAIEEETAKLREQIKADPVLNLHIRFFAEVSKHGSILDDIMFSKEPGDRRAAICAQFAARSMNEHMDGLRALIMTLGGAANVAHEIKSGPTFNAALESLTNLSYILSYLNVTYIKVMNDTLNRAGDVYNSEHLANMKRVYALYTDLLGKVTDPDFNFEDHMTSDEAEVVVNETRRMMRATGEKIDIFQPGWSYSEDYMKELQEQHVPYDPNTANETMTKYITDLTNPQVTDIKNVLTMYTNLGLKNMNKLSLFYFNQIKSGTFVDINPERDLGNGEEDV